MSSKHTDLVVILDRSGSMENIARDMEGGFNSMIREQRAQEGTCNVTLVQFDSEEIETVYTGKPVGEVPPLVLSPRGGTPLLQAVGQTITQVETVLAHLPEDQRPEQVMVLIITDGQENTSREFTRDQVKTLVERKTKEGWAFVYLGANVDAFAESGSLGISTMSASPYTPDAMSVNAAYASVSANLSSYRTRGLAPHFSNEQRANIVRKNETDICTCPRDTANNPMHLPGCMFETWTNVSPSSSSP